MKTSSDATNEGASKFNSLTNGVMHVWKFGCLANTLWDSDVFLYGPITHIIFIFPQWPYMTSIIMKKKSL